MRNTIICCNMLYLLLYYYFPLNKISETINYQYKKVVFMDSKTFKRYHIINVTVTDRFKK